MALTKFNPSATPGSTSFGTFKTFSNPTGSTLSVEELLTVARAQGGSIAEVAEELTNPRRSILATAGEGIKNAFTGFIDLIGTPSNIVAGAISSEYTIQEAMDRNLLVSDVLLGDRDEGRDLNKFQKTGQFFTRLAIDVLTDPLTYVTFGASKGMLGITGLRKITANDTIAKRAADLFGASDEVLEGFVTQRVKKQGLKLSDEALAAEVASTRTGLNLLKNVESGKDITLSVQGENLLNKYIANQRNGILQSATDKQIKDALIQNAKQYGKKLSPEEITKKIAAFKSGADTALINSVFKNRISPEFAVNAMNNMLANNPALASTLIDKGGIKFFGKSLLSGQRIKSTIQLVPGFSHLDNLTKGFRNRTAALFDTSKTIHGKLPDEFVGIRQRVKDLASARKDQALTDIIRVGQKLKLTEPELDLVLAALEGRRIPTDKRNAELWKALEGYAFDETIIRPEVFQGTRFMQKLRSKNLGMLRDSGKRVHESTDYVGHHLVKETVKSIPTKPGIGTATAKAQRMAGFSTFLDEAGERLPGFASKTEKGLEVNVVKEGKTVEKLDLQRVETPDLDDAEVFIDAATKKQYTRVRAFVEEAQSNGLKFENNVYKIAALDSLDAIKVSIQEDFTKEVAEKFGKVASQAPSGYVPVNIKGLRNADTNFSNFVTGKNGEEILFHPSIARGIEDLMSFVGKDDATEGVLKAFDNIQNLWKASVTSIWPAFHGRNAISNVFLHYLDLGVHSLNPTTHVQSMKLISFEKNFGKLQGKIAAGGPDAAKAADDLYELQQKTFFTDASGMDWTFGELRRTIKDNVVAFNSDISGQLDVRKGARDIANQMGDRLMFPSKVVSGQNVKRAAGAPFRIGREVGSNIEDQARIVSFLTNLKKTGDVQLAVQRTKQFLFDYQNLTSFEREFMRRMIPFYTFMKKNMALQGKTLLSNPGRISQEIKAIQTLGDVISDDRLTKEERSALPEWLQDSLTVLKSKKGSQVEIFSGFGTPIEAAFEALKPNQLLGSTSPIPKLALELTTGHSLFEGKALSEITNASAFKKWPPFVKDFIGYTEVTGQRKDGTTYTYSVALRPQRMHMLLNLPPTSRVFSALKQMNAVDVSTQGKIVQQLIGLKPFSFDLEVEEARRERELKKQIEDVLDKANIGFRMDRFVIPKDKNFGSF
jgi:hypothetical protein